MRNRLDSPEFFVGGNVLLRSTAHTPISENAVSGSLLNCQGSCINDRYSRLALYMAVLCLGQVGPLTNEPQQKS